MTDKITCFDIDGQPMEVETTALSWRPSVYGILIENNKILFCRAVNKEKNWDGYLLPGGGVELNETMEQSLKREFFEEVNLVVEPVKLLACHSSFFFMPYQDKPVNATLVYYLCRRVSGEVGLGNLDDIEKVVMQNPEWIDADKLSEIKIYVSSGKSLSIIKEALSLAE